MLIQICQFGKKIYEMRVTDHIQSIFTPLNCTYNSEIDVNSYADLHPLSRGEVAEVRSVQKHPTL